MGRLLKCRLPVIAVMLIAFVFICMFTTSDKLNKIKYNPFVLKSGVSKIPNEISDEYAKNIAKTIFGNEVVSRMLNRIKTPLSEQPPKIMYSNAKTTAPISGIWGGFIARSANIKGVSGKFNVTKATNGFDATWTGIGGFNGENLAQAGIDMNLMEAWYEMYPADPVFVFKVNAFDKMVSSINYDNNTGYWDFLIQDLTTGKYYSNEFNFNPDQTTAEWAVEVVGNNRIGRFGTVNFSDCLWKDGQFKMQSMDNGADSSLVMSALSGDDRSILPSKIGADHESFSMTAD